MPTKLSAAAGSTVGAVAAPGAVWAGAIDFSSAVLGAGTGEAHGSTGTVFDRNFRALAAHSPRAAAAVYAATARADLDFVQTPTGHVSASITEWAPEASITRWLASRRDPIAEAKRLADRVNVLDSPVVAVIGFGLGYHVAEVAARVGHDGIVVVFEPDVPLLRAVLERVDCSEWLTDANVIFLCDGDDDAAIADALRGLEGVVAMGVEVIEHPASVPRLAEFVAMPGGEPGVSSRFVQRFTKFVKAARTTIVTTMVQTEGTLRNLSQNLDIYATREGITDLAGAAKGRAAIVVSAGPSLWRNIELLRDPAVREKFVVIAVQTVLKPMLAKGIKPDFVTALDFHEISARFYEGLTPEDVQGVTLVVEPKVNPAVPLAFPGRVRCVGDGFLDKLLGEELSRPMGALPPGATVAHLAYYLARHMGCDPVVLIGQDLGFTDGQYYSAGAAIHTTWAAELNEFNTLEMLEWQRIVRMRGQLRREKDHLGRTIYTDEQMSTYLVQFQRDFKIDAERGLSTIDATEGGVAKAHTRAMTLREAIAEVKAPREGALAWRAGLNGRGAAEPKGSARGGPDASRLLRVAERVRSVRQMVWRVGEHSRKAGAILGEMLEHHADQERVNRLITRVESLRDEVTKLQPAFKLVEILNQTGAFNRHKSDRRIHLGRQDGKLSALEVQRQQIERDATNVRWLADAADALGRILDDCAAVCERAVSGEAVKRTRDPVREEEQALAGTRGRSAAVQGAGASGASATESAVQAVICVDPARSGLGVARDLGTVIHAGRNALQMTLARLARVSGLAGVTIVTRDIAAARRLVGETGHHSIAKLRIEFQSAGPEEYAWPAAVARAGRLWAADSWRGGLGNLTCYDEELWPRATAAAISTAGASAALVVGPDWGLVDPELCSAAIARYQELPRANRVTFSQAAPGLGPCVIDRDILAQIAERRAAVGSFASVGGVLGYVPTAPTADLIAKHMCVQIDPAVRDALHRCTLDAPARAAAVMAALGAAGLDPFTAGGAEIARAVSAWMGEPTRDRPRHIVLRVIDGTGRMSADKVTSMLRQLGEWAPLSTVTLAGDATVCRAGCGGMDLLDHPQWTGLVPAARAAGIGAVQLRTTLRGREADVDALLGCGAEVIGVDLVADDAATYERLTGRAEFEQVRRNFKRLMTARAGATTVSGPSGFGAGESASGIRVPWVVPRMTRRDAVYEQIEGFYDYWLLMAGWAVIDPLPAAETGARIEPLPLPSLAARRRELSRVELGPDGKRA